MPIKKTDKATPPTEIARRIRSLKRFFRATSSMGDLWRLIVYLSHNWACKGAE